MSGEKTAAEHRHTTCLARVLDGLDTIRPRNLLSRAAKAIMAKSGVGPAEAGGDLVHVSERPVSKEREVALSILCVVLKLVADRAPMSPGREGLVGVVGVNRVAVQLWKNVARWSAHFMEAGAFWRNVVFFDVGLVRVGVSDAGAVM
jgi:hypothetical protein